MELDQRSLDLAASRKRALEAERLLAEKDEARPHHPVSAGLFNGFQWFSIVFQWISRPSSTSRGAACSRELWQVFSDTCQRLLDAQRRIAQLEDELTTQAELQQSLESRLQGAKAQQTSSELEVRWGRAWKPLLYQ